MKKPIFEGVCTAMVTPFTEDGIDYACMGRLIDRQFEAGTTALLICGTTGEAATMTSDEHERLLRYAAYYNNGRMKLIAGIGANRTETALHYGKVAQESHYDGVLMVTPYYNKTTQDGLVQHFTYVADRIDLPMILYNVPSRTGISIAPDTYLELSKHPNINGVKEASGDLSLVSKLHSRCGDELNIWSGNDDQTLPMMSLGAKGVISVASNVIPGPMTELCSLCLSGKFEQARSIHETYAELFEELFMETNPIPVKTLMNHLNLSVGCFRLPLVPMKMEHLNRLLALGKKYEFIVN